MYTVTVWFKNKRYQKEFTTSKEAEQFASAYWYLGPSVRDPDNKPVPSGECVDSEY